MRGPLRTVVLVAVVTGLGAQTAGAQTAAPDPVTATYVATYQRECKAVNRRVAGIDREFRRATRGARTERAAFVRTRRVFVSFYEELLRRSRPIAVVVAPPQFAAYQARAKAEFVKLRPRYRSVIRAARRAGTIKALDRVADRTGSLVTRTKPPAALRSAAPACRKAL